MASSEGQPADPGAPDESGAGGANTRRCMVGGRTPFALAPPRPCRGPLNWAGWTDAAALSARNVGRRVGAVFVPGNSRRMPLRSRRFGPALRAPIWYDNAQPPWFAANRNGRTRRDVRAFGWARRTIYGIRRLRVRACDQTAFTEDDVEVRIFAVPLWLPYKLTFVVNDLIGHFAKSAVLRLLCDFEPNLGHAKQMRPSHRRGILR